MEPLTDTPRLTVPVGPRDHAFGPATAPFTLVEYGDYECPHCRAAHPSVQEVIRRLGDRVRLVYRHFPLSQVHPHAFQAAEAAEAAGAQGRFWQMHALLFGELRPTVPGLVSYARALGLNLERFTSDLETHAHAPKVRDDFRSGVSSGVNGTPTFFVNGVRHDGGYDVPSLLSAFRGVA